MYAAVLVLVLPWGSHGYDRERLPSQNPFAYRFGCTPANRHCERCRDDGCRGPTCDYRRLLDYPWYPPYHRPLLDEVPYDIGPRIIPLSDVPGELTFDLPCEQVPPPGPPRPGVDDSSPSDKLPRIK
jgi:hypothetical protein